MEELFDFGKVELCRKSMVNLEKYKNRRGYFRTQRCSMGLFDGFISAGFCLV